MAKFTGDKVSIEEVADWRIGKLTIGAQCSSPIVIADADLLFRAACDLSIPLSLAESGAFCAVRAWYQGGHHMIESERLEGSFMNTGLMVVSPAHRNVFEEALRIYDSGVKDFWGDEGPINIALKRIGTTVHLLPESWNVIVGMQQLKSTDVARHYTGGRFAKKTRRIRAAIAEESLLPSPHPSATDPAHA